MGFQSSPPARSRVPLRRRPMPPRSGLRWSIVAMLTVALVVLTSGVLSRAETARRRWGTTVPVLVTSRPVPAGAPFTGSVEVRSYPRALVPDGALDDPDDIPKGAVATSPHPAGEALTRTAVAPGVQASGGPLVAVATTGARPRLKVGDRVSLWATYDPSLARGRATTSIVTAGATVVVTAADSIVVEVHAEDVRDVVEATALATVTVVSERR